MASAMQIVTKWVSPWTTAIILSCSSGVVVVQTAPSRVKIPVSRAAVASEARAGQTTIVWPLIDDTVGPNIGWSPITSAFDASMAFTGATLIEVKSQRSWCGSMSGAIVSITFSVSRIGTETTTMSQISAISRAVSAVVRPETSVSYPARVKTGAKSRPIFPVPPIIPAFMLTSRGSSL